MLKNYNGCKCLPERGDSVVTREGSLLKSLGTINYVSHFDGEFKVWFSDYDDDFEYLDENCWSEEHQVWIRN